MQGCPNENTLLACENTMIPTWVPHKLESSLAFLMSPTRALGEAHLTRTWILYSSDLNLCSPPHHWWIWYSLDTNQGMYIKLPKITNFLDHNLFNPNSPLEKKLKHSIIIWSCVIYCPSKHHKLLESQLNCCSMWSIQPSLNMRNKLFKITNFMDHDFIMIIISDLIDPIVLHYDWYQTFQNHKLFKPQFDNNNSVSVYNLTSIWDQRVH
jgi:hypothetical protein